MQLVHVELPVSEYRPEVHEAHELDAAPEYFPATHVEHEVAAVPTPVYMPAAQSVHPVAPLTDDHRPSAQVAQTDDPVEVVYCPAVQLVHTVLPGALVYVPCAQAVHGASPVLLVCPGPQVGQARVSDDAPHGVPLPTAGVVVTRVRVCTSL